MRNKEAGAIPEQRTKLPGAPPALEGEDAAGG